MIFKQNMDKPESYFGWNNFLVPLTKCKVNRTYMKEKCWSGIH